MYHTGSDVKHLPLYFMIISHSEAVTMPKNFPRIPRTFPNRRQLGIQQTGKYNAVWLFLPNNKLKELIIEIISNILYDYYQIKSKIIYIYK